MVNLWGFGIGFPSRARAVNPQLRKAGLQSVWSSACQDQVVGGHAGVGVVSPGEGEGGCSSCFHHFAQQERRLGAYPVDFTCCWTPSEYWDTDDIALEMSDHPNIWTDGSREDFSSLSVGFRLLVLLCACLLLTLLLMVRCGVRQKSMVMLALERCRAFLPVPRVLQTVQRAEFWSAIIALQAYWPCHLGIDNLNVARSIGRLLDRD